MAQIQVFQGGSVQRDAPNVTPIRPVDFGPSGLGEGLQKLGQAGSELADVTDRISEAHDEAAAKEAANAVSQHFVEIGYTGPNAYFDKQGKDALELRPTVDKSLDSFIQQSRAALTSQRQQHLFDDAIVPQRQQWGMSIAAHALKETRTYAAGESKARSAMTGELARLTYFDNPDEGEKQLDTMSSEIANQGQLEGWGPDQVKAAQLAARSGAYKDLGSQLAIDGGDQGPELARAFVDKHRGSMTGDDAGAVLDRATVQQNHLEAEQRRQEAEARREAREAASDARDRAQTAISRLDDGTPLSTNEYASALEDAKASGDNGLISRLQDGQFKNTVTLSHSGATPTELQDELNGVSARISKAGKNATHEDIVTRDVLQSMLSKANGEITSDQLSYGASHYGVQIGPLNFNDAGSIASRLQAATAVSRRTGRPPAALTNEEAAQLAAQWHGDNTGQKVGLALNLAKLGALGPSAAQQVAPNDAGFANAVSLGSLKNRAVANFRVNQVMTGQEVLKTKPKLIDRTIAQQQFQGLTGNAFQFLPQVRQGVYSNATAILASEANKEGWSEWGDASRRWPLAVNEALGAYDMNGKRYGGLVQFNGGTTILPEDMDQATFEQKISRAQGPQIIAASGKQTPVVAGGRHPTASEIKKMQWVPVDDGVYRVTDGHGFVRTTGGGFYEIDVRKLP